jgi:methionine--tRNA ligase beta chain
MINYDDFQKLEIKIGTILEAEKIEGADKLLKLKIDLGYETRTLVAGIAQSYKPASLIGKQIPILTNLEPRTLRGVESQGMILACVVDEKAILLKPIKKVLNGTKIK